jgi:hypothetical protein
MILPVALVYTPLGFTEAALPLRQNGLYLKLGAFS